MENMRTISPQEAYPPTYMQIVPIPRLTARWRSPDGMVYREVTVPIRGSGIVGLRAAEDEARAAGWPGHAGSRWDYLKDDMRALWHKLWGK